MDIFTDFFIKQDNFNKYKTIESRRVLESSLQYTSKVSIVIPTFNRTDTLITTIESILTQKNFYYYDIIVIDNNNSLENSTEEYLRKLKNNKISYYRNDENIGQIGNWNRGIELANAEWVVLLHDDDILMDSYLYNVFKVIDKNDDIEAIGTLFKDFYYEKSKLQMVGSNTSMKTKLIKIRDYLKKKSKSAETKLSLKDYHFECGYYAPIGAIYKKKNIIDLGGFNDEFFPISDWVFHVNYMLHYNFYILSLVLTQRGIGINESFNKNIRVGFVENGYYFRKAILKRRRTIFGEWWIQIVSWYKAKRNFDLLAEDLDTDLLNTKYNTKYYELIYLCIYRLYNITKKY